VCTSRAELKSNFWLNPNELIRSLINSNFILFSMSKEENYNKSDGWQTDGLLEFMTRYANEGNWSLGITVSVHGNIISGLLVGYKRYYERFLRYVNVIQRDDETDSEETAEELREAFREFPSEIPEDAPVNFIHLEDAIVVNSNRSIFPSYWRININSIDAFMLGKVEVKGLDQL